MNIWVKRFGYALGLVLAFFAGIGYEWSNSPLASPMCFDSGRQFAMAVVKELSYWVGWGILLGIPALIALGLLAFIGAGIWRLYK